MNSIDENKKLMEINEILILRIVSKKTGIKENIIKGNIRLNPVKIARQLVHFYIHECTGHVSRTAHLTFNSHATVYNSKKRVLDWGNYPDYKENIEKIEPLLKKFGL